MVTLIQGHYREFDGNVRMGNIQFDKALGVFNIIILPVILLPISIEKFKGIHLVFLLVAFSPIFDNFDDLIRHGEGGDRMGFFNNTGVDVEDLVCALAIASGTKEYASERARVHNVGNGWIIVGFNVGSKGGLAVFFEIKFLTKDNLAGVVFVGYRSSRWEAIKLEYSKVDKVDNNLVGGLCIWEV